MQDESLAELQSVMDQPSPSERPRRIEVARPAVLVLPDGHECRAAVKDVSAKGFRIEVAEELFVGEHVQLCIGKEQPVMGEIRWTRGREAGGIFL